MCERSLPQHRRLLPLPLLAGPGHDAAQPLRGAVGGAGAAPEPPGGGASAGRTRRLPLLLQPRAVRTRAVTLTAWLRPHPLSAAVAPPALCPRSDPDVSVRPQIRLEM